MEARHLLWKCRAFDFGRCNDLNVVDVIYLDPAKQLAVGTSNNYGIAAIEVPTGRLLACRSLHCLRIGHGKNWLPLRMARPLGIEPSSLIT